MTTVATSKNIGLGFFKPEDSAKVETIADHAKAKEYLRAVVSAQAPKASPDNVAKAFKMIDTSKNFKALLMGMWSFMLAHDGNKLIR